MCPETALERAIIQGKIQPGDYIWTISHGWVRIAKIIRDVFTIEQSNDLESEMSYYIDGKYFKSDKFPSAFLDPLPQLDQTPKPIDLKSGDKVMVRMGATAVWCRRYFSHFEGDKIHCYIDGCTPWSSQGETTAWQQWRLPTEDEL